MKRTILTLFLPGFLMCFLLFGCKVTNMGSEEKKPLEYTVVKQEDIPPAIGSLIESKKQEEFQITYQDGEYLYLLRGYGRQKTGGYSIQVEELCDRRVEWALVEKWSPEPEGERDTDT